MQICIVSPGSARLAVSEKSITLDWWVRPESFSLVALHQGQKKHIVCEKLCPPLFASVKLNKRSFNCLKGWNSSEDEDSTVLMRGRKQNKTPPPKTKELKSLFSESLVLNRISSTVSNSLTELHSPSFMEASLKLKSARCVEEPLWISSK